MKKLGKSILGLVIFSLVLFSCKTDPHEHSYSDKWSSNETEHWHEATCEHSSEVSDKAAHTFGEWKVTKDSTEETEGSQERSCSICSYKETKVIKKHVHSIATDWSYDSEKHWHAASCGKEEHNEDIYDHTWNHTDYKYDAEFGKNIRVCTVCLYVDIKDHIHTEDSGTITTESDCVTKGVKTYKCTVCDAVVRTEDAELKAHTEDSGTITTEPDCISKGIKTYKCKVCNAFLRNEEVAAKGHSEDSGTVTKTSSKNSEGVMSVGVMEYKCSECYEFIRKELYCGPSEVSEEKVEYKDYYENTKNTSFSYIYFGVFPKTSKASSVTVNEEETITMGGNTYYQGNDDEWYAKVDTKYYKVEPIKWKLLTTDYAETGKVLLLSDYVLTGNIPFYITGAGKQRIIDDKTIYNNNYKYSTIRAYLNGKYESGDTQPADYEYKGFLQTAFDTSAQTLIIETEVNNGYETTGYTGWDDEFDWSLNYSQYYCDNTTDKIFLLSQSEVYNNYDFADLYDCYTRIRNVTDYAKANNACSGNWWLRSPGLYADDEARNIDEDGRFVVSTAVYYKSLGVVPAMWINLK